VSLFQGSTPVFRVWEAAEDDKLTLILPSATYTRGEIVTAGRRFPALPKPGPSGRL
jgi:hypothetical protein